MRQKILTLLVLCITNTLNASPLEIAKTDLASKAQCTEDALKAVRFIEELGWGLVPNDQFNLISATRDIVLEQYRIESTLSGYTYTVEITQDYSSLACIITSINTK